MGKLKDILKLAKKDVELEGLIGVEALNALDAEIDGLSAVILDTDGLYVQKNSIVEALGEGWYNKEKEEYNIDLVRDETLKGVLTASAEKIKNLNNDVGVLNAKIKDIKVQAALKDACVKHNALDIDVVSKFIENDKIVLEGEDVKGIEEQVKELKANKGYLFVNNTPNNPAPPAPTVAWREGMSLSEAAKIQSNK